MENVKFRIMYRGMYQVRASVEAKISDWVIMQASNRLEAPVYQQVGIQIENQVSDQMRTQVVFQVLKEFVLGYIQEFAK